MVPWERFELSWVAPRAPKARAYTNSATKASIRLLLKIKRFELIVN